MVVNVLIVAIDQKVQKLLENACFEDSRLKIVGKYRSIREVQSNYQQLKSDVIVCTEELLDGTGYRLCIELMKIEPIPVLIICNELSPLQSIDHPEVLGYGIVGQFNTNLTNNAILYPKSITVRINILSKLNVNRFLSQIEQANAAKGFETPIATIKKIDKVKKYTNLEKKELNIDNILYGEYNKIIAIGSSTGGPPMLEYLIKKLPSSFPPILIVQHMPPGFIKSFAERINNKSLVKVKEAENGEVIEKNTVYIAPGGFHLEILKDAYNRARIIISDGPKVNFVKPSVDITLFSLAREFGSDVISVILTGMGSDGKEGCKVVKQFGGKVIALNEADSVVYGMNKSVIESGLADYILGVKDIIPILAKVVRE